MMSKMIFGVALLVGLSGVNANAEDWGDTNYVNPSTTEVQAEEIPSSIADENEPKAITEDALASANEDSYRDGAVQKENIEEKPVEKRSSRSSVTNISTVRNTYGVMTEEKPGLKLYAAPFGGISSVVGNATADASARYALGATVGLLVSSNMMIEVGYTYSEQNLSNPRSSTLGAFVGAGTTDVFALKQNSFDAGVKLFFLGRESRFRPFFGGGMGYSKSYLNYTPNYQLVLGNQPQYASDFVTNQYTGFGEVGAEFAFTKAVVATAMFKLNGVLSSNTTNPNATDSIKGTVGDSLSRTASYTVGAGVGIYF
jgi:outer membrane protein W